MIADWPGLKPAQLYEERDLKPTTDLRAVLKGLLRDHLRVEERALASKRVSRQHRRQRRRPVWSAMKPVLKQPTGR